MGRAFQPANLLHRQTGKLAPDHDPGSVTTRVMAGKREHTLISGSTEPFKVLYLEDDTGLARLFQKRLARAGHVVHLASDGDKGLEMATVDQYDVLVVDHRDTENTEKISRQKFYTSFSLLDFFVSLSLRGSFVIPRGEPGMPGSPDRGPGQETVYHESYSNITLGRIGTLGCTPGEMANPGYS